MARNESARFNRLARAEQRFLFPDSITRLDFMDSHGWQMQILTRPLPHARINHRKQNVGEDWPAVDFKTLVRGVEDRNAQDVAG